jgi:predicted alpha/beta-fold hydrolase
MRRLLTVVVTLAFLTPPALAQESANVIVRGKSQTLTLYGKRGNPPVLLTSGDLGWAGLVTHVAELLAQRGYFVVGVNSRAYLESFTSRSRALTVNEACQDYLTLTQFASEGSTGKLLLAGISEGAGLSVLAATNEKLKPKLAGVVAIGLPNEIELGWRWSDFTIWITKRTPNEPIFRVADYISKVAAVPLAEIHSTHDEFLSLTDARNLMSLAGPPKKMWEVEAANHRFSNNQADLDRRLSEALDWTRQPNAR